MLVDTLTLLEGGNVINLTLHSGPSFPNNPNIAELYYKTNNTDLQGIAGFYIYDTAWRLIALGNNQSSGSSSITLGASYPSTPTNGQLFYKTDNVDTLGVIGLYVYVNGQWQICANSSSGITETTFGAAFPSSSTNGQLFYKTDNVDTLGVIGLYAYIGGTWIAVSTSSSDFNNVHQAATFPASSTNGTLFYKTDNVDTLGAAGFYVYASSAWQALSFGSSSSNSIIPTGTSFPASSTEGQLFFKTSNVDTLGAIGLYTYTNDAWVSNFSSAPEDLNDVRQGPSYPDSPTEGYIFYKTDNVDTLGAAGFYVHTLGTWIPTLTGSSGGDVLSVAGRTGNVTLSASDIANLATSATTDTTNANNITSGTLDNERLASIIDAKTKGSRTRIPIVTINTKGLVTTLTEISVQEPLPSEISYTYDTDNNVNTITSIIEGNTKVETLTYNIDKSVVTLTEAYLGVTSRETYTYDSDKRVTHVTYETL